MSINKAFSPKKKYDEGEVEKYGPSSDGAVMKKGLGTIKRINQSVDGNKPIMQELEDEQLDNMVHELEEGGDEEEIRKKKLSMK
jgi:hypothetical protein